MSKVVHYIGNRVSFGTQAVSVWTEESPEGSSFRAQGHRTTVGGTGQTKPQGTV